MKPCKRLACALLALLPLLVAGNTPRAGDARVRIPRGGGADRLDLSRAARGAGRPAGLSAPDHQGSPAGCT